MTTVRFSRDYTSPNGIPYRAGLVVPLSDSVAADLIRQGVAEERPRIGPTEFKYEPEPEVEDE